MVASPLHTHTRQIFYNIFLETLFLNDGQLAMKALGLWLLALASGALAYAPNSVTFTVSDLSGVWSPSSIVFTAYTLVDATNASHLVAYAPKLPSTTSAQITITGSDAAGALAYQGSVFNISIPLTARIAMFLYSTALEVSSMAPTILSVVTDQLSSTDYTLSVLASSPAIEYCLAQQAGQVVVPPGSAIPGITTWLGNLALGIQCSSVILGLDYQWSYIGGSYIDDGHFIPPDTTQLTNPTSSSASFSIDFDVTRQAALNFDVTIGGMLNPITHGIQILYQPNGTMASVNQFYNPIITTGYLSATTLTGLNDPTNITFDVSAMIPDDQEQNGHLANPFSNAYNTTLFVPAVDGVLQINTCSFLTAGPSCFTVNHTSLAAFISTLGQHVFTFCTVGVTVTGVSLNANNTYSQSSYYARITISPNTTVGVDGIVSIIQTPTTGIFGSTFLIGGFVMFQGGSGGVVIDTTDCAIEPTPYSYSQFNEGITSSSGWTPGEIVGSVCNSQPWSTCTNYTACDGPEIAITCNYCLAPIPYELEGPCYTNTSGVCMPNWGLFFALDNPETQLNATALCAAYGASQTFTINFSVTSTRTDSSTATKQFIFESSLPLSSYVSCGGHARRSLSVSRRSASPAIPSLLALSIELDDNAFNLNVPASVITEATSGNITATVAALNAIFPGANATIVRSLAIQIASQYASPTPTPTPTSTHAPTSSPTSAAASDTGSGSETAWKTHQLIGIIVSSCIAFILAVVLVVGLWVICRKRRTYYSSTELQNMFPDPSR
jgi:hypothetical protein